MKLMKFAKAIILSILIGNGLWAQENSVQINKNVAEGSYSLDMSESVAKLLKNKQSEINLFCGVDSENLCDAFPKIMGYKIQVFISEDRKLSEENQTLVKKRFPSLLSVMVYKNPTYRVLTGDFLSRGSAQEDLKRIKAVFPKAILVEHPVLCENAK